MTNNELMQMPGAAEVEIIPPQAVDHQHRAEYDVAVNTARRYPRNLNGVMAAAQQLACYNEDIAAACTYSLRRDGKAIVGGSIRLAEIMATCWSNLDIKARVVEIGDTMVKVEASCRDLQTNSGFTVPVVRRITNKKGERYSEDMIATTINAAIAIAQRNAIFKVVPKVFVEAIREKAVDVASGDGLPLERRRTQVVERLKKSFDLNDERICRAVKRGSILELTFQDLELLIGLGTAVKEGDESLETAFPEIVEPKVGGEEPQQPKAPTQRAKSTKAAEPKQEPLPADEADPDPELDDLLAEARRQDIPDLVELVTARSLQGETGKSIRAGLLANMDKGAADSFLDRLGHWWLKVSADTKADLRRKAGLK